MLASFKKRAYKTNY